jgi:crossover junction endodeoxyribonuclease RuvC
MPEESKVIIGIDPGTRVTGFGVIKMVGARYEPLDYGCIKPPANYKLTDRYLVIFESVDLLLDKFQPDALSIETQFMHKNVQSALKLGMARGAVIIAAKRKKIPVFEYTPLEAKKAVVGNGRASKQQVQWMIKSLLGLKEIPEPEDAADALALSICQAHAEKWQRTLKYEI